LFVLGVVAVLVGGRLLLMGGHDMHADSGSKVEGNVAIGGAFALQDGDGKDVTDESFRGKQMLVYFGYTFCPDVCPTELGVIAKVMDALTPEEREKVVPIFITVDPERDTPAVMKTYTAAFHPQIVGLTGTTEQIDQVKKVYHIYAAKVPGGDEKSYSMDHSSVLYLMGSDGAYVAHYGSTATVPQIVEEIHRHLS
jgi:protein SCO1/2